jgi:hypothetical protein
MSTFINLKTSLQKTLEELITNAQSWMKQLNNMPQANAEEELEEYNKALVDSSDKISNVKIAYGQMVEAYLNKYPPKFSQDVASNLREYDKLIVFSSRIGNKKLLLKWGIEEPRSRKLPWFQDQKQKKEYIEKLNKVSDKTPGLEGYYKYLIDNL